MEDSLEYQIKSITEKFLESSKDKEIYLVSHFDTDGITSATLMIKTLKKLDKKFSVKILKNLEPKFIQSLPKDKLILFLDLASGSLNYLENSGIENIFIIDHHEVIQQVPKNVNIINPELNGKEKISSSGLTYLFCREINPEIKEFAKLAILGMIGDFLEKEIDKLNNNILNDGEIVRKKGLLIYPSTRPINRTLEYCSNPYIPGVTGNIKGVLELLREIGLNPKNGKYPSLIDLEENEMKKLVTSIILRNPSAKNREMLGEIFLIKMYNKLEDARELSAMINACSRMDNSATAMQFCMENSKAKKQAESIHTKYKQHIISALRFAEETEKIKGNNLIIINAQNNIKDTIIGTTASILSNSATYEQGTIITTMGYSDDKIKISARNVGREGRNVREVLNSVIQIIGGEVGGHQHAAGAIIAREKEQDFIDNLKKIMEIPLVRI